MSPITSFAGVLSVNVGIERPIKAKGGTSGIDKRPVRGAVLLRAPGPDRRGGSGLVGDHICDTKHHGGDDQAVYAYAREDLDNWERDLGHPLSPGSFGENLTTSGMDVSGAVLGERWRIGDVVLEVSSPRVPCRTFAVWLGERQWMARFTAARTPGAYLRVLTGGSVCAGSEIVVSDVPEHGVTIATAFAAITTSPELLPVLLEVDTYPGAERAAIRRRLARGGGLRSPSDPEDA